jgi:hypothetical protein
LSIAWTKAQDDFIRDHVEWHDVSIAINLERIGPERTAKAVEARRKALGVKRQAPARGSARWHAACIAANEKTQGWPSVPRAYQEQDRKHLKSILHALRGAA